jgi:hypothetical protein
MFKCVVSSLNCRENFMNLPKDGEGGKSASASKILSLLAPLSPTPISSWNLRSNGKQAVSNSEGINLQFEDWKRWENQRDVGIYMSDP